MEITVLKRFESILCSWQSIRHCIWHVVSKHSVQMLFSAKTCNLYSSNIVSIVVGMPDICA